MTVSVNSTTAGDLAATWTFSFTTSASGALGSTDSVTMTFPAGIDVSGANGAVFGSGFAGSCSLPPPPSIATGQNVEVDLTGTCTLPASTQGTITMTGISPAAGIYPASGFTVATDVETTPLAATGSDIVISGGGPTAVSAVSFAPVSPLGGATTDWTVGFTSSSTGSLVGGAGFGYVLVTYPAGFTIPSPTLAATLGSGFAGTCNGAVGQNVGGQTIELDLPTGCTLAVSTAASFTLNGVANPGTTGNYSGASVSTLADVAAVAPASNITITSAPTFTVHFDPNGGTGSTSDETFTGGVAQALTANAFTRTGSTFAGWNTTADGTGTNYSNSQSVTITNDLTLYARWTADTFTVHFDPNGGTGSTSDETFTGGVAQALTANAFTRTGSTFAGWNTTADGTGTNYSNSQSVTITSDLTLYARWTANTPDQLVFTTEPTSGTAGSALAALNVTAEQSGSADGSFGGSVTLAIATGPSGAALSGTSTVTAVAGVATFTGLSLDKAGTYTLTATASGATASTSAEFTIDADDPSQLVIQTQPGDAIVGEPFGMQPVVKIEDRYGNLVTSTQIITATRNGYSTAGDYSGHLGGGTSVTTTTGIATFTDLSFPNYDRGITIQFADGSLPLVNSGTFRVAKRGSAVTRVAPSRVAAAPADGGETTTLTSTTPPSTETTPASIGATTITPDTNKAPADVPPDTATTTAPTETVPPPATDALVIQLRATTGTKVAGTTVRVDATGLLPNSEVAVTVHSTPQVIARLRTNASGSLHSLVKLPSGLEAGSHHLIVEGFGRDGNRVSKTVAFSVDGAGRFVRNVASAFERLAKYVPVHDAHHVIETFTLTFALLAVAGAGGIVGGAAGIAGGAAGARRDREERRRKSGGAVSAKTKYRKWEWASRAPGDASWTWKTPGWRRLDRFSLTAPQWLATRSPLLGRLIADAAYARAMVGVVYLVVPASGVTLGVVAALDSGGTGLPPAYWIVSALLVVGVVDALAGFLGGCTFVVGAGIQGAFLSATSTRTILGVLGVCFAPVLIAAAARPFRRPVEELGLFGAWTRVADAVVGTLLAGWATQKIIGSWAGLSGRMLPILAHTDRLALLAMTAITARFILETACAFLYPERLQAVTPRKLPFPGKLQALVSSVCRTCVFMFFASAYLGFVWELWAGAALFLAPSIAGIYQFSFPNSERLYRLLPGGILKVVTMLFIGQWYFIVFRHVVSPGHLLVYGFVFLGIPGVVLTSLGFFGRDGSDRHEGPRHQFAGTIVLGLGTLLVLGYFS